MSGIGAAEARSLRPWIGLACLVLALAMLLIGLLASPGEALTPGLLSCASCHD
ncbi:hypothetical protein SAMN05444161_7810 [Rhizobiales bacterium GAS191]|jgi:hypothetical protein|nr:hypothetical protein SAMN05519103_07101 [Rhizobiales bacterium GAS113]SEE91429.1 hypothetical protein SAMN05444161_7810 [Rhizobiales bacterium GAS191]